MASLTRRFLRWFIRHMSLYPPFLGAGIRVVTADPRRGLYRVRMKLTFLNRNFHGTHFGGSLYAMCDAFYGLILIEQLGSGYMVWDKTATIEFLKPGRGAVTAEFRVTPEQIATIRDQADADSMAEPVFTVDVIDASDHVVARVTKTLHVQRKTPAA